MSEKTLENKLFSFRDWIPLAGLAHMLYRSSEMPINNAVKTGYYITGNAIYHVGLIGAVACYYVCNQ